MGDTNKKIKTNLSILLVIFIVLSLFFLTWSFRGGIKKFLGFATVYDTVKQQAVTAGYTTNSNSYAWGESVGWINFSSTTANPVVVAGNALWGYAYGENIGWISLNCGNTDTCGTVEYRVANDGNGKLSGYAYGENIGWVHFGTTATDRPYGVSIASGDFTGYAWGENIGWISFNSTNPNSGGDYKVSTNWVSSECTNGLDDDGDGLIDTADTGCQNGRVVEQIKGRSPNAIEEKIIINKPSAGSQWTTGNSYQIVWEPISTTTDTFVYMVGGGYDVNRVIAMASSTDLYMDYYVTDEDLPKNVGDSWRVAVCSGEIVGEGTDNCGFSGDFFVNSSGKKVEPIKEVVEPTVATSSESTTDSSGHMQNLAPIQTIELPVVKLEVLKPLVRLPTFGDSVEGSFNFVPKIKSFVFEPIPEDISNALSKFPSLSNYLMSLGIEREQDIIRLNVKPISLARIPLPIPEGLFIVEGSGVRSYLSSNSVYKINQLARVISGTPFSVYLFTDKKVVAEWNGQKISFVTKDGKAILDLTAGEPGTYILKTPSSPYPLIVEVLDKSKTNQPETQTNNNDGWLLKVSKLFGR